MAAEEPKFMFIQPVLKSAWDSMDESMRNAFVDGVVRGFVKHTWEVRPQTMPMETEDGEPLPEMVAITGTIELRA